MNRKRTRSALPQPPPQVWALVAGDVLLSSLGSTLHLHCRELQRHVHACTALYCTPARTSTCQSRPEAVLVANIREISLSSISSPSSARGTACGVVSSACSKLPAPWARNGKQVR